MNTRALRAALVLLVLVAPLPVAADTLGALPDVSRSLRPLAVSETLGDGLRAGAAKVDATWRVGASAGQYAGKGPGALDLASGTVEPHSLAATQTPSHGIHSRDWIRALVVEGGDGTRVALISNDLYIPQDLLNRRVEMLLEEHDRLVSLGLEAGVETGITDENMTISVTHNHSSPYYSAMSWGPWAFQDTFDIRFFEHVATAMADAVIAAVADLRPARIGAAAAIHTLGRRHSYGPSVANDGLPAGYPQPASGPSTQIDPDLTVIAVDDVTDPARPKPLATWFALGLHPENLKTPQLLTTEYVGAAYRSIDREVGGVTLFSQNDTGSVEPAREARAHFPQERQEFSGAHIAQMERQARQVAETVIAARADIAAVSDDGAEPERAHHVVPFAATAPVRVATLRFAPPGLRASPTVSNCRMEKTFDGNPGVPVAGIPNCAFLHGDQGSNPVVAGVRAFGLDPRVTYDTLREAGVPVPDNVGAPSYVALQETVQVKLQAIRFGDIAITVCPCEQYADQALNIKSRLTRGARGQYFGFDWTANSSHPGWEPGVIYDGATDAEGAFLPGHGPAALGFCSQNPNTTWTCDNPNRYGFRGLPMGPESSLPPVSDAAFRRMKAQIYNDARGWDALENAAAAESEPIDIAAIWGNFTHEELQPVMDGDGYGIVMTVGMANDYWGYIPPYREFQDRDHYRKALAGLGPHSMDFLATRLSRLAASLRGGPVVERNAKDLAYDVDSIHQRERAEAIGKMARAWLPTYEAQLPADGGTPRMLTHPTDVERFGAARVSWVGGSNYTDSPHAVVQRCVATDERACDPDDASVWEDFGDGAGDVQVRARFPRPEELPAYRAGLFEWRWEATFEAYASDMDWSDLQGRVHRATPTGTYRFVIDGCHRGAIPSTTPSAGCSSWDATGRVARYTVRSAPFRVAPWGGLEVAEPRIEGGEVSFAVGPISPYPAATTNTGRGPVLYPDSYVSPFPYISPVRTLRTYGGSGQWDQWFCFKCAFRPWADTGAVASVTVTAVTADGPVVLTAVPAGSDRWAAAIPTGTTELYVAAGGLVDEFGNRNRSRIELAT